MKTKTYTLENKSGLHVELTDFGAGIRSITIPTPNGPVNALLTYPEPDDQLSDRMYLGSTVGRYANRIENADFLLDGKHHTLLRNNTDSPHCLHGGPTGFSHRHWQHETSNDADSCRFKLVSRDRDQGFPGTLEASVTYSVVDDWKLLIRFQATTDAPTVVNLANHAYFNLNSDSAPVDNHLLSVNADRFTPVKANLIPNGEKREVSDSGFDLRQERQVGEILARDHEQLSLAGGLDHNFVLNRVPGGTCRAARLFSPQSGLALKVYTTQPGIQVYTGQHLSAPFAPGMGICLEAQNFPNAPNTLAFPGPILRPGEHYEHVTIYEFSMGNQTLKPA